MLRYDNETGKGDQRQVGRRAEPYEAGAPPRQLGEITRKCEVVPGGIERESDEDKETAEPWKLLMKRAILCNRLFMTRSPKLAQKGPKRGRKVKRV